MSDENRNYPPVPPAPPSATPQEQTAATAQGGPSPAPPVPPTPGPQQGWQQPPAAAQQPQAPPQQNGQQPPTAPQQGAPQQQQKGAQQTWQQTHEKLQQQAGGGAPTWEQLKASGNYHIPPEYPADKFNPESFSIPALLLSWIWYMVKGMWQKGVAILVAMLVVSRVPILSLPLGIAIIVYAGVYGHRDYMRFHNSKQQFWF